MDDKLLRTYLNDHLAGAVAAVGLARNARSRADRPDEKAWLDRLIAEIEEDRRLLVDLLERIGGSPSRVKRPMAWLAERAARLKLSIRFRRRAPLGRVQQMEALHLGIRGKLALWTLLEALAHPRYHDVDLPALQARARRQMEEVDTRRLELGRSAFG